VVSSRPAKTAVCASADSSLPTDQDAAYQSCKSAGHRPTKTPAEPAVSCSDPAPPRRAATCVTRSR